MPGAASTEGKSAASSMRQTCAASGMPTGHSPSIASPVVSSRPASQMTTVNERSSGNTPCTVPMNSASAVTTPPVGRHSRR